MALQMIKGCGFEKAGEGRGKEENGGERRRRVARCQRVGMRGINREEQGEKKEGERKRGRKIEGEREKEWKREIKDSI